MARMYKSARGKMVDMDKIKIANETTTAVGNMKVNARGDLIGSGGQVAQGRNQLMDKVYAVPAPMYSPNSPAVVAEKQAIIEASKAKELHDLANTLVVPSSPETIEPETKPTPAPSGRGSLASSVAKTVNVTQEPVPDTRKSKGPSRI